MGSLTKMFCRHCMIVFTFVFSAVLAQLNLKKEMMISKIVDGDLVMVFKETGRPVPTPGTYPAWSPPKPQSGPTAQTRAEAQACAQKINMFGPMAGIPENCLPVTEAQMIKVLQNPQGQTALRDVIANPFKDNKVNIAVLMKFMTLEQQALAKQTIAKPAVPATPFGDLARKTGAR